MPLEEEEEDGGFRRFSYRACTQPFSMLKVRVVDLEYS